MVQRYSRSLEDSIFTCAYLAVTTHCRLQVHHDYGICFHESTSSRNSLHLNELVLAEFGKLFASLFYNHVNNVKLDSLRCNLSSIKFIEFKILKILCWDIKKWLILERRIQYRMHYILNYDKTSEKIK